jgi:DNA/RNA endonuclease YhcR with UshA esterase domain
MDDTRTDHKGETMSKKGLAAAVVLFLASVPVWAHHSFAAEFDERKPLTLTGVVTKMEWVNPHAWIHLDVKNPDGTVTNWAVEGGTPNTLLRKGFTKDSLLPGTEIVVQGYQAKRGGPIGNGSSIEFKDGRKLFLGSSANDAPADEKK